MTTRREKQHRQIRKKLLDALHRLKSGLALESGVTTERVAPPYKINPYTVQREAGVPTGTLRKDGPYADVLVLAEQAKTMTTTLEKLEGETAGRGSRVESLTSELQNQ